MSELQEAEMALLELTQKVAQLRKETPLKPVRNYTFTGADGELSLKDLFGDKSTLFLIHNMGQACRFCTLWADGLNGFIAHIESQFALALVSKDDPETQRRMSNSRQWRFRMVSHAGGKYISEQSVLAGQDNMPGLVCYILEDGEIYRKNAVVFGPGDEFCSQWNLLSLAGISEAEWAPQYQYWKRPAIMVDGGENLE
ncbi:MAG: putative dithiol-disulfide oxidoreductase (DUF899 family) [Candidatus Azotimanducaceae bacterium]|jgi:predicted dithiol-disulfide oxidoreductase (DUF899 family)